MYLNNYLQLLSPEIFNSRSSAFNQDTLVKFANEDGSEVVVDVSGSVSGLE